MRTIAAIAVLVFVSGCLYRSMPLELLVEPDEQLARRSGSNQALDWTGVSVREADQMRIEGLEDGVARETATTFKTPGFSGIRIIAMNDVHPRATHIALFVGSSTENAHMPIVNFFGGHAALVYADMGPNGLYDKPYSAAPASSEVFVPIEQPGISVIIVGFSCTNTFRCREVWKKRVTRGSSQVQLIDNYNGVMIR